MSVINVAVFFHYFVVVIWVISSFCAIIMGFFPSVLKLMQYTKLFMCEAHVPETIAPAPVIFREKWAPIFFQHQGKSYCRTFDSHRHCHERTQLATERIKCFYAFPNTHRSYQCKPNTIFEHAVFSD